LYIKEILCILAGMRDVMLVDRVDQAAALLKPVRLELLRRMTEPRSCPELARALGESTQKVNYHVRVLEEAGLVERVAERRVRSLVEGVYRARADSYWLSPGLVGRVGGARRARDRFSLGLVVSLAEELQADVARLADESGGDELPTLGLSAEIEFRGADERAAFMHEVQGSMSALARKYGAAAGEARGEPFRLVLACYPRRGDEPTEGRTEA
jgi:DNA-binding transcriptional ArsR family regulator